VLENSLSCTGADDVGSPNISSAVNAGGSSSSQRRQTSQSGSA
jgi:hypothetical protein